MSGERRTEGTSGEQHPRRRREAKPSRARGMRPSARDAFIDTTAQLLRRQGYTGTGLNEIVARSGAPKGSLYFHFPGGKEQLALAAMQRAGGQLRDAIAAILGSSDDLGEALARLLDTLAAGLERSDYRDGCPIATVALELASDSETLRAGACTAFESWLEPLEQRLTAAGLAAPLARRRALHVLAAIEGALILARATRGLESLEAVREELRGLSL
jgi:TetR/AcrR family transcriptional repressor of lmrAB and yxaGH operons